MGTIDWQPIYLVQTAFYSLIGIGAQLLAIRGVLPLMPAEIVTGGAVFALLIAAHGSLKDGGMLS